MSHPMDRDALRQYECCGEWDYKDCLHRCPPGKCKHDPADHVRILNATLLGCPITLRCDSCGHWLPLGPSDETEPRVAVEIRAAELSARKGFGSFSNCGAGCERCGFLAHRSDTSGTPICKRDQFDAGYLARCILEHGEGE